MVPAPVGKKAAQEAQKAFAGAELAPDTLKLAAYTPAKVTHLTPESKLFASTLQFIEDFADKAERYAPASPPRHRRA
jgi:hypothetical protein